MDTTTTHTPADVRERVARECVEEAERLRRWYGEGYAKAQRLLREAAALLRTPRGEGEGDTLWRDFEAALVEFEAAAIALGRREALPLGPREAAIDRVVQARRRVIACACALAALRSDAQGNGPVGAVCANCGAHNAAIAGGELDPDEAVCSVECYEQLRELGCPQEHGGTYRPKPARRGEGGGK